MGILAAFVFAAQMINFPVVGGTSGHLVGGALVAILIGPWASVLVMTCVCTVVLMAAAKWVAGMGRLSNEPNGRMNSD